MSARTSTLSTRESILDAGLRLLARLGYRKSSMDDLAREAGLARRTIYLHFASKEAVFLASIDRVVEELLAKLTAITAEEKDPVERVRRMLVTRVLHRVDSVRDYYQSLDEMFGVLRKTYLERRERYFAAELDVFVAAVHEGITTGRFAAVDARSTARTMLTATNALLPYSLSVKELGSRKEIEREVGQVAELLLQGLVARGAKSVR